VHVKDLASDRLEELWPQGGGLKAIFLDYDGTLRELEDRPELATPTPELQRLLAALCAREDLLVHIISGRDAEFLSAHLGEHHRLTLIAEHERRVAGRFQVWRPDPAGGSRPSADRGSWKPLLRPLMETFVAQTPGSCLEEKASALVWHYRAAVNPALAAFMAELLAQGVERQRQEHGLREVGVSLGHKVVEVFCRGVTKGEVMRRICEDHAAANGPFKAVLVAGDDVSDESMFASAPEDFLTVKVGPTQSLARFRVDDPEELRALLWRIAS